MIVQVEWSRVREHPIIPSDEQSKEPRNPFEEIPRLTLFARDDLLECDDYRFGSVAGAAAGASIMSGSAGIGSGTGTPPSPRSKASSETSGTTV